MKPTFLPNLITLNSDGKNDIFEVKGLQFGHWQLFIYNRWGDLIYYDPFFMKYWEANDVSGGLYYYLFKNADMEINGWIEIIK